MPRCTSAHRQAWQALVDSPRWVPYPGSGCTECSGGIKQRRHDRSEEQTSELQSLRNLVCRLLLEKRYNSACALLCCTKHTAASRHFIDNFLRLYIFDLFF